MALGALLSLALVAAPSAQKIAIFDLEHTGVDASVAETVSLLVPTQVRARVPGSQVIAAAEVKGMLGFDRQRQLAGCADNGACIAEIGDALGVDEIVTGKLGKIGQTFVLEFRRIDVRHNTPLGSVTRVAKGSGDDLVDAVPSAIAELFPKTAAADDGVVATSGPQPPRAAWSKWAMGGGAVLLAGGVVGAVWANSVAQSVGSQQAPGAPLTVTRQDARTAQTVYAASWVVAVVGAGAAAAGVWGFLGMPGSTHVSMAPMPGGAAAVIGGRF